MISSKVIYDVGYSNKSWVKVGGGMFAIRELNQMEREMCMYLDWELSVREPFISTFKAALKAGFDEDRLAYGIIPLEMVSKVISLSGVIAVPVGCNALSNWTDGSAYVLEAVAKANVNVSSKARQRPGVFPDLLNDSAIDQGVLATTFTPFGHSEDGCPAALASMMFAFVGRAVY
ncbi:hypothetical protein D9611_012446 [Ephemerocybe angulata]|uniref:Uncharacterized protein n=1 Tax=Ephemerocybe angulata TaxID=980116 RepID=A0A8H5CGB3_9AGAR|nr:hypothetical protein D9611_012446 [Tulosesus angulatus]